MPQEQGSERHQATVYALSLRECESACARSVCDLLHTKEAGRRSLRRSAGSGPGAGWQSLLCLRCVGRDKRSIIVHHRVPGKSLLNLMISLCPACHARIHRTRAAVRLMQPPLLRLWRELHTQGHEQTELNFSVKRSRSKTSTLFQKLTNRTDVQEWPDDSTCAADGRPVVLPRTT